ncbi:hypothetical protein [Sphingomonas sp.]|uniref:hypothetical protein n=1 Tax=Sphingomonas sp. TaxID=28214 RepID=UPI001B07195B|nr:hypothetical protein [Sphingomonas sp.]MBO9714219.1 hypothetical protein [Sphingomonas sp.]
MEGCFRIEVDVPRNLVRIAMSGFFTDATIQSFLDARAAAHAKLRCGPNQHLTLNDMRGMDVRSQQVVDAFKTILAAPEYRSRRLAFVVTGALSRMQLMRTLAGRTASVFEDIDAAEAWLLSEDGP